MRKTLIISCLSIFLHLSSFSQPPAIDKNIINEYFQNQQFEEAIAYLKPLFNFKARSYAKLLVFEKSNELLRTCLNSTISKTAELYYYKLGENFESMKQYKRAVTQYDTGYYLFRNPVLLYNSGRIYEAELKNIPKAKQYYTRYLQNAKPQSAEEIKATQYVKRRINDLK
jgi:tetratricopeptide (TPR) repeat protein